MPSQQPETVEASAALPAVVKTMNAVTDDSAVSRDKENESPQLGNNNKEPSSSINKTHNTRTGTTAGGGALRPPRKSRSNRSPSISSHGDQQPADSSSNSGEQENNGGSTGLQTPGFTQKTKGALSAGKARNGAKANVSEPPATPSAESVIDSLGLTEEDRQEFLRQTLKRTKPPTRLTGVAKTFMDKETNRLASGIKTITQKTGELVNAFIKSESAWRKNDEASRATVTKLSALNKVHKGNVSHYKSKMEELQQENTQVKDEKSRIEQQVLTLTSKMQMVEDAAKEVKQQMDRIVVTSKRDQKAVQDLTAANEKLNADLKESQLKAKEAEKQRVIDAEALKSKTAALDASQAEVAELKAALEEFRVECEAAKAEQTVTARELELVKKAESEASAQLDRMRDAQKNSDDSMKTALGVLQENQQFSQVRIEELVKDKTKLEALLDELRAEKVSSSITCFIFQRQCCGVCVCIYWYGMVRCVCMYVCMYVLVWLYVCTGMAHGWYGTWLVWYMVYG
jgi:hypothetical protein